MQNLYISLCLILSLFSCQNQTASVNEANKAEVTQEEKTTTPTALDTFSAITNKTIEDYYLNIPAGDYFNCEFENIPDKKFRSNHIIIKDIKNGYLLATDSLEFTMELALFKDKENSRDILGVFNRGCNIGGQCPPSYDFWTFQNGEWQNISKEVFDEATISAKIEATTGTTVGYKLPQFGTEIKVINCDNERETNISIPFKNGKFEIIKGLSETQVIEIDKMDKSYASCIEESDGYESDEMNCLWENKNEWKEYLNTKYSSLVSRKDELSQQLKEAIKSFKKYSTHEEEFIELQFTQGEDDISHRLYISDEIHYINRIYAVIANNLYSGSLSTNNFSRHIDDKMVKSKQILSSYGEAESSVASLSDLLSKTSNTNKDLESSLNEIIDTSALQHHLKATEAYTDLANKLIALAEEAAKKHVSQNKKQEFIQKAKLEINLARLILLEKVTINR